MKDLENIRHITVNSGSTTGYEGGKNLRGWSPAGTLFMERENTLRNNRAVSVSL